MDQFGNYVGLKELPAFRNSSTRHATLFSISATSTSSPDRFANLDFGISLILTSGYPPQQSTTQRLGGSPITCPFGIFDHFCVDTDRYLKSLKALLLQRKKAFIFWESLRAIVKARSLVSYYLWLSSVVIDFQEITSSNKKPIQSVSCGCSCNPWNAWFFHLGSTCGKKFFSGRRARLPSFCKSVWRIISITCTFSLEICTA